MATGKLDEYDLVAVESGVEEKDMGTVPVTDSLQEIYAPETYSKQAERWNSLISTFKANYGAEPDFVARSPGRVNIIGEHIDYSLYDVLPMAIAEDVIIAVSAKPARDRDTVFSLSNVDASKFKHHQFYLEADGSVAIDASTHEWTNYFKAGMSGAFSMLKKKDDRFQPVPMTALVDGSVPAGGGLSSSAAFVCAAALATLYANGLHNVSKRELVELAIVSERAVGVNSGGMDQSASVFGLKGHALALSFSPSLHAEMISFPRTRPQLTFMIAQSFVAADKHVTAPVCYNLRVVECTLAAEYMAACLGLTLEEDKSPLGRSLRGFQNAFLEKHRNDASSSTSITKAQFLDETVAALLTEEGGYDRETIAEKMKISVSELEQRYMTKFPIRADKFMLRQRAIHVFDEVDRVREFMALLRKSDSLGHYASSDLLEQLGSLMNATQDSCRRMYDCSCPELNALCEIAQRAGAYGSRLTGAGWGGCTVHLVPKYNIQQVRDAWHAEYYKKKFPNISEAELDAAVVVSEPGSGACIWKAKAQLLQ